MFFYTFKYLNIFLLCCFLTLQTLCKAFAVLRYSHGYKQSYLHGFCGQNRVFLGSKSGLYTAFVAMAIRNCFGSSIARTLKGLKQFRYYDAGSLVALCRGLFSVCYPSYFCRILRQSQKRFYCRLIPQF